MKRSHFVIICITALLLCTLSYSQNKSLERAFKNENYIKIIKKYEESNIDDLDEYEIKALAYSYFNNNNLEKALPLFIRLKEMSIFKEIDNFYLSHCYKRVGAKTEGKEMLKEYYKSINLDYEEYFKDIELLEKMGDRYKIESLETINTEYSDYYNSSDSLYIYFSSSRPNGDAKYKWNGQHFLNLYKMSLSDSTITDMKNVNSNHHDADISFSKLKTRAFYTSNRVINENDFIGRNKIITTKIFSSTIKGSEYGKGSALFFNSDKYSCKNPYYDWKNEVLYFSSDMPDGYGGFDLYKVSLKDNSKPENLGPKINTKFNDDNIYIDEIGNIFFSSEGYVGFGSKDVYMVKYDSISKTYERPLNVGLPLNTEYDDFAYSIVGKKGYYSSNKNKGNDDDIFKITETKPLELNKVIQTIEGYVYDIDTNVPLPETKLTFTNSNDENFIIEIKTDSLGYYSVDIPGKSSYEIKADKFDYGVDTTSITLDNEKYKKVSKDIYLKQDPCVEKYYGTVRNADTNEWVVGARVAIYNLKGEIIKSTKADDKGYWYLEAPCGEVVDLKSTSPEGTLPFYAEYIETLEIGTIRNKEIGKDIYLKEISTEGLTSNKDGDILIPTDPIYFDYGKAKVKTESLESLKVIVNLMEKNKDWLIKINSHSDIRGSAGFNLGLSKRRATATKYELTRLGVESSRITTEGYGEEKPLINCEAKECSEEEHAKNRRSEFAVSIKKD